MLNKTNASLSPALKTAASGAGSNSKRPEPANLSQLGQERQVEIIPVSQLTPYKGNARTHSKRQIRQIADSIGRFGCGFLRLRTGIPIDRGQSFQSIADSIPIHRGQHSNDRGQFSHRQL